MTLESVTVLCVDDDPSVVDLTATFLEREHDEFTVLTETSASDALDRLADTSVDCIVSDCKMPGMDGIDFLEAVREDYPDLPFILITGVGSEGIAEAAIEADVTSYLQKRSGTDHFPILADRIETAVRQHRRRQRVDRLEREYGVVAELATDAFWTIDLENHTVTTSAGIEQFGYDPDTDVEREWFVERVHPDDREHVQEHVDALLDCDPAAFDELGPDRGTFSHQFRFHRADGTYAHVESSGAVVFEHGDPVTMVVTMSDVTERRERQRTLSRLKEQLQAVTEELSDLASTGSEGGSPQ